MNKDKQIKEMAKTLGIAFQLAGTTRFGEVAEVLVNAGYRKASEVAREIFEEIDEIAYRYLNDADYSGGDMIYDLNELKKKYQEGEG